MSALILAVAFGLLCVVLYFEKTQNRTGLVPTAVCPECGAAQQERAA